MSDNATAKTATREFCSASLAGASRHLAWGVTRFDTEVCDCLFFQSAKASVSYKYKACLEDTRQEAARWLDGSLLGVPITRVQSHEHKRWPLESVERLERLSHEVHSDNSKALLITCPCSVNVSTMWRKQKWPRQHSESPSAHSKLSRKDQAKYPHTSAELIWKSILKGVLKNLTMCILHSFTHLRVPCDSACLSLHVWPLRIRPLHHAQPQRGQRSSEPWSCAEVYLRSKRSHLVHSTFSGLKNRTRSESSNVASKLFCLCKLLLKIAGKHSTGCWHHHKGCRLARTQTQGEKSAENKSTRNSKVQMACDNLLGHCKHYYKTASAAAFDYPMDKEPEHQACEKRSCEHDSTVKNLSNNQEIIAWACKCAAFLTAITKSQGRIKTCKKHAKTPTTVPVVATSQNSRCSLYSTDALLGSAHLLSSSAWYIHKALNRARNVESTNRYLTRQRSWLSAFLALHLVTIDLQNQWNSKCLVLAPTRARNLLCQVSESSDSHAQPFSVITIPPAGLYFSWIQDQQMGWCQKSIEVRWSKSSE